MLNIYYVFMYIDRYCNIKLGNRYENSTHFKKANIQVKVISSKITIIIALYIIVDIFNGI